jgi:uncharacterized repeat protein (TIGR03843 family)
MTPRSDDREVLRDGELTVLGRIRSASNATFLCESTLGEHSVHCVYKPVSGEQPLWDFPDGTLAGRELAAYLISTQLGWNIVPYTIIRHGPAGPGMLQLWVEQPGDTVTTAESDPRPGPDLVDLFPANSREPGYLPVLRAHDYTGGEVILMHADDIRLWRMAVFDVLINNADRKGGHVLRDLDGHIYGVDHGVSLHVENKLRTVLWGWAGKRVDKQTLTAVAALAEGVDGSFAEALAGQITDKEVAALRNRAQALLADPVMPGPNRHRAIPWPAF